MKLLTILLCIGTFALAQNISTSEPSDSSPILRITDSPIQDSSSILRVTDSPVQDSSSILRITGSPVQDSSSILRVTDSPIQDSSSILRVTDSPIQDSSSILRVTDSPPVPYLIESGDMLEINVMGEEELTRTLMVMHNGMISFPLIGEVKVAGLTTSQAEDLIATELKEYYTYPMVSVVLKSPTQPYVSVFGEVVRQGAVEYQRGLRVTDYIALAGGPTNKANLGKVKVVRFQEGEAVTTMLNLNKILKSGDISQNFELKSGDWIYVYKRLTINWTHVLQFATLTLTAINLYITIQNQ